MMRTPLRTPPSSVSDGSRQVRLANGAESFRLEPDKKGLQPIGRMKEPYQNPRRQLHWKALYFARFRCLYAMDEGDYDADSNSPDLQADLSEGAAKYKGHRRPDPIWDQFKKRKLSADKAAKLKRNYDAECNACGTEVAGKPQMLHRHVAECKKVAPHVQIAALKEQARQAGSEDSGSAEQTNSTAPLDKYVDRVKVTPNQKARWQYLLAVAFVMTGWAFRTVEDPHFVNFMAQVRPNFELPSMVISFWL